MTIIGRSVLFLAAAQAVVTSTAGDSIRTVAEIIPRARVTAPFIDDQGRTAFTLGIQRIEAPVSYMGTSFASLTAVDGSMSGVYFERQIGSPDLIVTTSQQPPGVETGIRYGTIININLGPGGDIAFKAGMQGSGISSTNDVAVFAMDSDGVSRLVFRENQIVPDTGGVQAGFRFGTLPLTHLDANGRVTLEVFNNDLEGVTRIWQESVNGAALLSNLVPIETPSRQGPVMVNFKAMNLSQFNSSRDGRVVYRALLQSPNFPTANGIVAADPGGESRAVARIGEDFSAGQFSNFFAPSINRQGDVAFVANWSSASSHRGILRERAGDLEIAVQIGDIVTQIGPEVVIASLQDVTHFNDRGDVAFSASLAGPGITNANNVALYVESPITGLSQIVRRGDQAPGTELGAKFATPALADLVLNNAGQTAFYSRLTSSRLNDAGIWANDLDGKMHLIARVGDLFDVSDEGEPADLRTVLTLAMNTGRGNATSLGSGFNDRGQIAFTATFTDGTQGMFVSNAVAIPEPATVAILLLGVAAVGVHRRARRTR